jgi:hypothetical protein
MPNDDKVTIKGRTFSRRALRKFLDEEGFPESVEPEEDGRFQSPITGEYFDSIHRLMGHVGAYLRAPRKRLDLDEPTRKGYVRRLRAGQKPTPEQREAHRDYQRRYRASQRGVLDEEVSEDREPSLKDFVIE